MKHTSTVFEQEVIDCLPTFDLLARQIEDTNSEAEKAIVQISTRFQAIGDRVRNNITQAARSLGEASDDDSASMDQLCEMIRKTLKKLLENLLSGTKLSEDASRQMGMANQALKKINHLVEDVALIASKARLLALNAQIEASRVGEQGQAFMVVAQETKALAEHAAKTTNDISRIVDQANRDVTHAAENLNSRVQDDRIITSSSQDEVESVLRKFGETHSSMRSNLMEGVHTSEALNQDLGDAIVALQFQDRMSQRLLHVSDTLREMREAIETSAESRNDPDYRSTDWVSKLMNKYTMEQERNIQGGTTTVSTAGGNIELF